jgi:hypothetical protein
LQEEGAHALLRHLRGQLLIRVAPGGHHRQIDRAHRVDQRLLGVAVGDRRDVGDDEAADRARIAQRQRHRGLAAHGMTDHVGDTAMGGDDLGQIGGEVG